jgi:hypothetical protein
MYYVTEKNVPEIERMAALRHFALQYHFSAVLSGPLTYSCAFSPPFRRLSRGNPAARLADNLIAGFFRLFMRHVSSPLAIRALQCSRFAN